MAETILIVDDSTFIIEGLVAILKKTYRPLTAYSGEQCLEILKSETPDIIILDILMEPMDGWETLARIKTNPKTRDIPVLMFSAKKISPEEAEEHRISIDEFISKPVTPHKLIEAIENVLSRRKSNRVDIENWKHAGIGQAKIDEYITLTTNLEVDLGLLQNMKVQHDLVHDDIENLDLLQKEITAIEERIDEEKCHAEELSREMRASVPVSADANGYTRFIKPTIVNNPVFSSVIIENSTEVQAVTVHTPTDKVNKSHITESATLACDESLPIRIPALSIQSKESTLLKIQCPVVPSDPAKEPSGTLSPGNPPVCWPQITIHETSGQGKYEKDQNLFSLYEPETIPAGEKDKSSLPPAHPGIRDSPVPASVDEKASGVPQGSPVIPVIQTDQQSRTVIPQALKVSPGSTSGGGKAVVMDATLPTRSGTDTAMKKINTGEDRSPEKKKDKANNTTVSGDKPTSSFGSFLSGIISIIRGIFHRPGK